MTIVLYKQVVKRVKILGFGTSFTESAAYTFSQTSAANQQEILEAYWYVVDHKQSK